VVAKLLDLLTPRNREIMERRYGLNGYQPHSLEELAVRFGLTRERIRQVQADCLRKWWRRHQYFGLSIREEREMAS
jgi:DNA-directed RNA polymerase sigma subunit (sigma70/sigma32)